MNYFLLVSSLLSIFIVIGHFTVGKKLYLLPMLKADFDEIPKKIMQSLFHYSSVYLTLSAIFLTYFLFNLSLLENGKYVIVFIGTHFILNAIVQMIIAINSNIEKPLAKLFQWSLFILTGIFSILSIY